MLPAATQAVDEDERGYALACHRERGHAGARVEHHMRLVPIDPGGNHDPVAAEQLEGNRLGIWRDGDRRCWNRRVTRMGHTHARRGTHQRRSGQQFP